MTVNADLRPAAQQVKLVAAAVLDEQLDGPTPCPDYSVRDLLAHLVGLTAAFRDAAEKRFGAGTDTDPGSVRPVLGDDWRTRLPRQLEELGAAWQQPAAWDGETRAGGIDLPAAEAGVVALNELVLHGWDLARATDQDYAPDRASLEVCRAMLASFPEPEQRGGAFGPVVGVPDEASLLDRVVGLGGRDPSWTPKAG